jgi:hypothetical protein
MSNRNAAYEAKLAELEQKLAVLQAQFDAALAVSHRCEGYDETACQGDNDCAWRLATSDYPARCTPSDAQNNAFDIQEYDNARQQVSNARGQAARRALAMLGIANATNADHRTNTRNNTRAARARRALAELGL